MTAELSPDIRLISRAAGILRSGGIVVYPTETVYGIGCDPFNESACVRVRHLKGNSGEKTMLLLACCRQQVEEFAGPLESLPARLADRFWPGSLTMIIKPAKELPAHLLGPSGGVAFRVTPNLTASALATNFGRPVISTSANRSGEFPAVTFEEAVVQFGSSVDIVLPADGPLSGIPSTVVDITGGDLVLVREGGIPFSRLSEVK